VPAAAGSFFLLCAAPAPANSICLWLSREAGAHSGGRPQGNRRISSGQFITPTTMFIFSAQGRVMIATFYNQGYYSTFVRI
jgi:hypothetical protein